MDIFSGTSDMRNIKYLCTYVGFPAMVAFALVQTLQLPYTVLLQEVFDALLSAFVLQLSSVSNWYPNSSAIV
jgi:hypothetical protein